MVRLLTFCVLGLLLTGCAFNSGNEALRNQIQAQDELRNNLKSHYEKGEMLYKAGKLDEARTEFLAMLSLKEGEPNANYRLGTIAFKLGEFEESALYFDSVIQADPKNYKAHYNLAAIRLMQAENHFKYYAALVDPDTDLEKVSKLMADIDSFNSKQTPQGNEKSLDQLATSLKK